jgi:hypothetical protein
MPVSAGASVSASAGCPLSDPDALVPPDYSHLFRLNRYSIVPATAIMTSQMAG